MVEMPEFRMTKAGILCTIGQRFSPKTGRLKRCQEAQGPLDITPGQIYHDMGFILNLTGLETQKWTDSYWYTIIKFK